MIEIAWIRSNFRSFFGIRFRIRNRKNNENKNKFNSYSSPSLDWPNFLKIISLLSNFQLLLLPCNDYCNCNHINLCVTILTHHEFSILISIRQFMSSIEPDSQEIQKLLFQNDFFIFDTILFILHFFPSYSFVCHYFS